MGKRRQYELPLSELIDKLTILQLRETLLNSDAYVDDIRKLEHDIDFVLQQQNIVITARSVRIIFLMGQLNTLIWVFKDRMAEGDDAQYTKYLKLAHQINGLKNELKNALMGVVGDAQSSQRTNTKTDGLAYHVSI